MAPALRILYEDNHLLAVDKPAGLPTMGVAADRPSLLTEAKHYLKVKYHKPGNVYLGIVSRLDAPVTGLVIMARTSKAAARLTEQFRCGDVQKYYWAAVAGKMDPPGGELNDWIRHDDRHRRVHIASAKTPGAKQAKLLYRTLEADDRTSLLEIELITGRKHQIRVQLAHAGHPIVGDRKYGSTAEFPAGIALHARQLKLEHPVRRNPLCIESPLPNAWRSLAIAAERL